MDKKMRHLIRCFIFGFMIVWLFCNYCQAQIQENPRQPFESENEIISWGDLQHGFGLDTINLNIEGIELIIQFGNYCHGEKYNSVYVYLKNSINLWNLICVRHTYTSEVFTKLDEDCRELIFVSESGKKLMIIPYEILHLDFERADY